MSTVEAGHVTGTRDKDYNIIWFVEACLSNALRLETYIQDAEREGDSELAKFFQRAQTESRKGACYRKDGDETTVTYSRAFPVPRRSVRT
jgi:hypothetical protein